VSESSSGKVSVENEKPKSKGKSKSGKSDKGVKHLTGALAKFWVD
jgi:hypothetical protein